MNQYPSYKTSGVDWLGNIPQEWDAKRIKFLFEIRKRIAGKEGYTVFSITQKGLKVKDIESGEGQLAADYSKYQFVEVGDFAMNHMDLLTGGVDIAKIRGVTSPDYRVFTLTDKDCYAKYFLYFFQHCYVNKIFYGLGQGSSQLGRWRLPSFQFNNFSIPVPPLPEQQAIAGFLDCKTAQIDTLIEKKQRQIDLLQEQRTALINHVVTKGLKPDATMKDSGVEWLGEIPSHWESNKLKFLVDIRYGLGQPPKELENGLPIIRATNVERGKIVSKDMLYIDPSDVPPSRNAILKENEIIVVRSGAYTADSAIVTKEYSGAVAGYDMVVTPTSINAQLLAYAFLSHYVLKHQLYLQRMRAAQPHLNAEELGDTLIIYPPSNKEQVEIATYLDETTKKISETIARANKQIELLREYRTALISEAVTGKIDVREWRRTIHE